MKKPYTAILITPLIMTQQRLTLCFLSAISLFPDDIHIAKFAAKNTPDDIFYYALDVQYLNNAVLASGCLPHPWHTTPAGQALHNTYTSTNTRCQDITVTEIAKSLAAAGNIQNMIDFFPQFVKRDEEHIQEYLKLTFSMATSNKDNTMIYQMMLNMLSKRSLNRYKPQFRRAAIRSCNPFMIKKFCPMDTDDISHIAEIYQYGTLDKIKTVEDYLGKALHNNRLYCADAQTYAALQGNGDVIGYAISLTKEKKDLHMYFPSPYSTLCIYKSDPHVVAECMRFEPTLDKMEYVLDNIGLRDMSREHRRTMINILWRKCCQKNYYTEQFIRIIEKGKFTFDEICGQFSVINAHSQLVDWLIRNSKNINLSTDYFASQISLCSKDVIITLYNHKVITLEDVMTEMMKNSRQDTMLDYIEIQRACQLNKTMAHKCLTQNDIYNVIIMIRKIIKNMTELTLQELWLIMGLEIDIWHVLDELTSNERNKHLIRSHKKFRKVLRKFVTCINTRTLEEAQQAYPNTDKCHINKFIKDASRAERYLTWLS